MEGDARPLILIDIDRVLAMHRGADCKVGAPIYRTGLDIPEAVLALEALGIETAVLTHRTRHEALCILRAVGLQKCSPRLISANDLFWQSLKEMLARRRMRGLSKAVAGRILSDRFAAYDPRHSVMIDDKLSNLERMTAAGVVGFGILTPAIHCDEGGRVRSFDLRQILTMAVALTQGKPPPVSCESVAERVFRFPSGPVICADSDLHTGETLSGSRFDMVTLLRTLKSALAGADPHP